MTLVDTTAWVGFLERPSPAPTERQRVGEHLAELIRQRAPLWTTEIVALEVLAGAQHSAHVIKLRALLFSTAFAPGLGLVDHEAAARLIRFLRARRGQELSAPAAWWRRWQTV